MAEIKKNSIEYQELRGCEKVKGIFRFHERPGGKLKFPFKKYKNVPLEVYELEDGEVYEIPRCVAEHLNKNCSYKVHAHCVDKDGRPSKKLGNKVERCSFQSLEF